MKITATARGYKPGDRVKIKGIRTSIKLLKQWLHVTDLAQTAGVSSKVYEKLEKETKTFIKRWKARTK